MTTAVERAYARNTARCICPAVPTVTSVTPAGGGSVVGPVISVTSAPRRRATRATAYPMRPLERFDRKRTGSIGSLVGPAVTIMHSLARSFGLTREQISSTMASGSLSRPSPV